MERTICIRRQSVSVKKWTGSHGPWQQNPAHRTTVNNQRPTMRPSSSPFSPCSMAAGCSLLLASSPPPSARVQLDHRSREASPPPAHHPHPHLLPAASPERESSCYRRASTTTAAEATPSSNPSATSPAEHYHEPYHDRRKALAAAFSGGGLQQLLEKLRGEYKLIWIVIVNWSTLRFWFNTECDDFICVNVRFWL